MEPNSLASVIAIAVALAALIRRAKQFANCAAIALSKFGLVFEGQLSIRSVVNCKAKLELGKPSAKKLIASSRRS